MFKRFPFARTSTIIKNANRFSVSPGLQPQPPMSSPPTPPTMPTLRIYENRSTLDLLNMLVMNTVCTRDIFVDNCHHLYNYSQKIVGKTLTEAIVGKTMGRIFTAGDSLKTVENFIAEWPYKKVNLYIDYSNEAIPGQEITKEALDDNTRVFTETIRLASKAGDKSGIAIKVSALCLPDVLLKANLAELNVRSLFSSGYGNLTETLTAKQLMNKLNDMKVDLTFADFQEFLSLFLNKQVASESELDSINVTKFEWLNNMHAFYIKSSQKNSNKILTQLANFTPKELTELGRLTERLDAIFDRAAHDKCTVLVDAEQTYMQVTIDFFTMQYSELYNKEMPIVMNTFQNYLKSTKDRVHFEHERCKALKLPFAAKLVRGAYMVEERRLAKELNYPDPIHDVVQDTHDCYNHNLRHVTSNWLPGSHLMVASHNEYSINLGKSLVKENNITTDKGNVSFVQLLGLADNLTFTTAEEGITQAKYVPFGPIPIMIPYLIRRAQESKQMLASAALQRSYVIGELAKRFRRN